MPIQVKAINGQTWQFDISKYLNIRLDGDGKHQRVGKLLPEPFPALVCILVGLLGTGQDRFFILDWKKLRNLSAKRYIAYLRNRDFERPRTPGLFHTALSISQAEPFENRWNTILDKLSGIPST